MKKVNKSALGYGKVLYTNNKIGYHPIYWSIKNWKMTLNEEDDTVIKVEIISTEDMLEMFPNGVPE